MCSDSTTCSTTEVVESCSFAILSLPSSRCTGNSTISQFRLSLLDQIVSNIVQAPKVWSPLTVGVLAEKTQVATAGKPTGESFSGPHGRRRSL